MKLNPIHWFFPLPPTPLEVAARQLIESQHALLTAQGEQERANASTLMLEGRILRLRAVIRELSAEAAA